MKLSKRIFSRKSANKEVIRPCADCKQRHFRNWSISTEEAREMLKKNPPPEWIIKRIKGED